MQTFNLRADGTDAYAAQLARVKLRKPSWFLVYAVEDSPVLPLMAALARAHPLVPSFGVTSFRGCFSPSGFSRDCAVLAAEGDDGVRAEVSIQRTTAQNATEIIMGAARDIERKLGAKPDTFLLHATPGYEERLLEGIRSAVGAEVPVYGGSAADDDIAGRWSVFANGVVYTEGFVLVGLIAARPILSGFVGGYLPTEHSGVVTKVNGRTVQEIEGRAAAVVYNEWSAGAIEEEVAVGGNILLKTNTRPVARLVGENLGMPRRLLSHPHEVRDNKALHFFSEFTVGERITMMTTSPEALVTRVRGVVERARRGHDWTPRGGVMIYCAGCLGMMLDRAPQIAFEFQSGAGQGPFVGAATFGEQGCFFDKTESRHGNLMCSVLLF